jgi:VWFA-related protein
MKRSVLVGFVLAAGFGQAPEEQVKFTVTTRLVVVNVEVKDREGRALENLRREDFEITEDGKPQQISVFEFQRLGEAVPAAIVPATTSGGQITPSRPGEIRYRDRRLIVLFFDLSSMPAEDQIRARRAAEKFIQEKLSPADAVAVMSFSTELRVLEDFSDDRDRLLAAVGKLRIGETSELAGQAAVGETETQEDTGAAFTADETEFNIFNTDRKLSALETAARMLASLPEKKALVYFASGVGKTGVENQSQLRATVNAAIRASVAFYPVDARGLVAEAPLGDARQAGARGSSMYSGAAQRQRADRFQDEQETLHTLAADTGGKALLDTNDLSIGIVRAQEDISSYYVLGYYSTNPAEDGKYRRVKVRVVSQPRARLDYRAGYFAPKRFEAFSAADRERQLEEALLLDDPITDLSLALEVNYFRRARGRYVVPVAVKIPGSEIRLARASGAETARFDFIGQVRDGRGMVSGVVRDHIQVKLRGQESEQLARRLLQYDTAFTLAPGDYSLKFLVRENVTGKIGTFETRFTIPDVDEERSYLKMSSVVWANQMEKLSAAVGAAERDSKLARNHPLVREGRKLIPSITRVLRQDQEMYVYFEVYESHPEITARVSLFRGSAKAFESEAVQVAGTASSKGGYLPVEFGIPLSGLDAARYVCQLSVIDKNGRKFAFRRTPLVVLP